MYEFHYKYIKSKFDTDSLIYEIKIEDAYEDFHSDNSYPLQFSL